MHERRETTPLPFDIPRGAIGDAVKKWDLFKTGMSEDSFLRIEETDGVFIAWLSEVEPEAEIDQETFMMSACFMRDQLERTVGGITPLNLEKLEEGAEKLSSLPEAQDLLELADIFSPNIAEAVRIIAESLSGREEDSFINGCYATYRIYFMNDRF